MKKARIYFFKAWRWLTSMRTALMLLFLLALAAIPGALLPQRSLNQSNVEDYIAANGRIARFYDTLQLYDVFSSSWFTAIYLLLMLSLVGCIIPRAVEHWKAYRAEPTRAPKYLHRLQFHVEGRVDKPREEVIRELKTRFRGWSLAEHGPDRDRAGLHSLSAERGHARELANLIFHLSIVILLISVAAGRMVYYEGQIITVTNSEAPSAVPIERPREVCNTSTSNYDSFRAGPLFDGTGLNTFCFISHDFSADYLPNGQAKMFTSHISYAEGEDVVTDPEQWKDYELKVNHPLRLAGDRIYLQGHGYAPQFTVTFPNGESRTQLMQWAPTDPTFFLSSGVLRFDPPAGLYPDLFERRKNQIAIQGLFAPTAQWGGENGQLLTSAFPSMRDPAVAIDVYRGDAGLDTGSSQSIWELDHGLIASGQLQRVERVNLTQGESVTLDDGTTVTFDGAAEFANYQVSHDPFQNWVLVSTVVMLVSLVGSLAIRRRRIYVRLRELKDGSTLVEMGGLARTDRAGWGAEFDALAQDVLGLDDPDEVEEESLFDADILNADTKKKGRR